MPIPGTASRAESLPGQVLAILRNVRSPKMRKAGMFLRLASVNRQARKACSRRAWRSGGAAGEVAGEGVRLLERLGLAPGAVTSLITNRWAWLSLKFSPAGKMLTFR